MQQQLKFGYPRRGLTGTFTTFRLGKALGTRTKVGSEMDLVDSKSGRVLARAVVREVSSGKLLDMAAQKAEIAHNWKEYPQEQRADLLVQSMKRRWPPGRCTDDSMVTVLTLEALSLDK